MAQLDKPIVPVSTLLSAARSFLSAEGILYPAVECLNFRAHTSLLGFHI